MAVACRIALRLLPGPTRYLTPCAHAMHAPTRTVSVQQRVHAGQEALRITHATLQQLSPPGAPWFTSSHVKTSTGIAANACAHLHPPNIVIHKCLAPCALCTEHSRRKFTHLRIPNALLAPTPGTSATAMEPKRPAHRPANPPLPNRGPAPAVPQPPGGPAPAHPAPGMSPHSDSCCLQLSIAVRLVPLVRPGQPRQFIGAVNIAH